MRETQIDRGVGDLDGAHLSAAVAGVHAAVGDRDTGPVQVVQPLVEAFGVLLHDLHVVREEFLGDEVGVGAHGVGGIDGQHPAAQGQTPQQRGELRHLVGFRADQPLGDHRGVAVGLSLIHISEPTRPY